MHLYCSLLTVPFSLSPSPQSHCTSPFPHSPFLFCDPPSEQQPSVWPRGRIIHWRMVAMDFYLCNSIILIIQTIATYLLGDINCNFWNFLLLHNVSFELLFHFLYFFILSLFHQEESILGCPESSMDMTGPVHLLASLCHGCAQTFEDHTSGSKGLFSEATLFLQKRTLQISTWGIPCLWVM